MSAGLDPDDFESEEKSDKSKNPNSIQSGKWQLGFQGEESAHRLYITEPFLMGSEMRKSVIEADFETLKLYICAFDCSALDIIRDVSFMHSNVTSKINISIPLSSDVL